MNRDNIMRTDSKTRSPVRWFYLVLGCLTLLLGGIIYSWSILKSPLAEEFGWNPAQLSLNFTITICCFGIGGLVSGVMAKKISPRIRLIISAITVFLGFFISSKVTGDTIGLLFFSYGVLGGLGIGILYNTSIATVGEWFPDKKGFCSGALLMCFGFSTLIFGGLAGSLIAMPEFGWRNTYVLLGTVMAVVVLIFGLFIRRPADPTAKSRETSSTNQNAKPAESGSESTVRDMTAGQMLKTATFWKLFVALTLLASIGNVALSFAKDFAMFTGSAETVAITIVGIMSVFNGFARICSGAIYDRFSLKSTQWFITVCMVIAPVFGILGVTTGNSIVGVVALILCGFSYGLCPTTSAVYPKLFFGEKNYALNFSITNLTLIPTSFVATLSGVILTSTGSYTPVFVLLLAFAVIGSVCLLTIREK